MFVVRELVSCIQPRRVDCCYSLNVTQLKCLTQTGNQVAARAEFVADVTVVAGVPENEADAAVVQLLRVVQFIAARVAGRVQMADGVQIGCDGAQDIPFHDLHVIDVVEQLDVGAFHLPLH